jgi:hypothetical protein
MNKYERFCVDEAQYHLNRAQELLTEGLRDPKRYYDEGQEFYKDVWLRCFHLTCSSSTMQRTSTSRFRMMEDSLSEYAFFSPSQTQIVSSL